MFLFTIWTPALISSNSNLIKLELCVGRFHSYATNILARTVISNPILHSFTKGFCRNNCIFGTTIW